MHRLNRIFLTLFLSSGLGISAGQSTFVFPPRFDVVVDKKWETRQGRKIADRYSLRENRRRLILHFRGNRFSFKTPLHLFADYGNSLIYLSVSGHGVVEGGAVRGEIITKAVNASASGGIYSYEINSYKLSGNLDSNARLHLEYRYGDSLQCRVRMKKFENGGFKIDPSGQWYVCPASWNHPLPGFVGHMSLQLPTDPDQVKIIDDGNGNESSVEIPAGLSSARGMTTRAPTANSVPSQPIAERQSPPQGAARPQSPYDPCKDPDQDAAMKQYCATKAYNAKVRQENAAAQAAMDAEIDRESKADEEAQIRLEKAWAEERLRERQTLESQRKAWLARQRESDRHQRERLNRDIAEIHARHEKIAQIDKMIDRFGEDYGAKRVLRKKVDALAAGADRQRMENLQQAVRKMTYDSRQIRLQGEADYEQAKAGELGRSAQKAEVIRDTALTANKVLARMDPTGTGEKIVEWQERGYHAIEGYGKGGVVGAVDSLVEKEAGDLSGGYSDTVKKQIEDYRQYTGKGLTLKDNEVYYDRAGHRLHRVRKWQKIYNAKGEEVSFSFGRRIVKAALFKLNEDHNGIQSALQNLRTMEKGIREGDVNKVLNAGLELKGSEEKKKRSGESQTARIGGKEKQR